MKKGDTYIAVTGQARNIKPTTMKDAVTQIEQTSVTMHGVMPLRLARTMYGVGGNMLCCLDESSFYEDPRPLDDTIGDAQSRQIKEIQFLWRRRRFTYYVKLGKAGR
jgi:hypothetical protein